MCKRRALLLLFPAAGAALFCSGCGLGGGEDVNARTLARARRLWERAAIADYDLEWKSAGARVGHYDVRVRGGKVAQITLIRPDGTRAPARPGDPSYYGIDGLFQTIEQDAENCRDVVAAQRDRGTRVLTRFWPHDTLGYPTRYRRDVTNALRSLSIDVVAFRPIPQPDSGPIPDHRPSALPASAGVDFPHNQTPERDNSR